MGRDSAHDNSECEIMKTRFLIYGSLLFMALMLPVVYKTIDNNLNKQEHTIREQKKDWLFSMATLETKLAVKSKSVDVYNYHFCKALDYLQAALNMVAEDIDKLDNEIAFLH